MQEQYFFTRQYANLMEDFAREVGKSSSIFLLFGDSGVGKSRLLDKLDKTRFTRNHVINIDCKSTQAVVGVQVTADVQEQLSGVIDTAPEAAIIIVDHFDAAANNARHALFQSWSSKGRDKKLNLIIAANPECVDDIRQLSKQYQAKVQSYQLLPCSEEEIEAYLKFCLFSQQNFDELSIPVEIQNQISHAAGNIGAVEKIVRQSGKLITLKSAVRQKAVKRSVLLGALGLIVVLAAAGYLIFEPSWLGGNDRTRLAVSEPVEKMQEVIATPGVATLPAVAIEPESTSAGEEAIPTEAEPAVVEGKSSAVVLSEVPVLSDTATGDDVMPVSDGGVETTIDAGTNIAVETPVVVPVEAPIEMESEAIAETQQAPESSEKTSSPQEKFDLALGNALAWLEARDRKRATIQIMSVGAKNFNGLDYDNMLQDLSEQQVNLTQVRIIATRIQGVEVFSVIYGEYDNRREAVAEISLLPEILRVSQPIPRTIGGLLDEINAPL